MTALRSTTAFLWLAALLGLWILIRQANAQSGAACFPLTSGCYRIAIPSGPDPQKECVPGEIYIDTNTSSDTNCTTSANNSLCLCTARNTWTALNNN